MHDSPPPQWSAELLQKHLAAVRERRGRAERAGRAFGGLLSAIVAVGVIFRLPEAWWMPAVGAVAILAVVFRLANWKCPNCGERLPSRLPSPLCRGCGAPLE